mgnify:CR=1 FL=1
MKSTRAVLQMIVAFAALLAAGCTHHSLHAGGEFRYLNPDTMPKPPPIFSQVVSGPRHGTPVYISGQVAFDRDGQIVGAGDMAKQMEQSFANLRAGIAAAGGGGVVEGFEQGLDGQGGIADEADRGRLVAIEHLRVDVRVDQRAHRVAGEAPGADLTEPASDCQGHGAVLDGVADERRRGIAETVPEKERMPFRKDAFSGDGGGHKRA